MSVTHYKCAAPTGCHVFVPSAGALCAMHAFGATDTCEKLGCCLPAAGYADNTVVCADHLREPVLPHERDVAIKKDEGKPPIHLVPRELIEGAARAYAFGARKYDAFNYRKSPGLAVTRLMDSSLRHALAWLDGEEFDPESGLCHLDHFAASVGMLMDTVKRIRAGGLPKETDDRWKP